MNAQQLFAAQAHLQKLQIRLHQVIDVKPVVLPLSTSLLPTQLQAILINLCITYANKMIDMADLWQKDRQQFSRCVDILEQQIRDKDFALKQTPCICHSSSAKQPRKLTYPSLQDDPSQQHFTLSNTKCLQKQDLIIVEETERQEGTSRTVNWSEIYQLLDEAFSEQTREQQKACELLEALDYSVNLPRSSQDCNWNERFVHWLQETQRFKDAELKAVCHRLFIQPNSQIAHHEQDSRQSSELSYFECINMIKRQMEGWAETRTHYQQEVANLNRQLTDLIAEATKKDIQNDRSNISQQNTRVLSSKFKLRGVPSQLRQTMNNSMLSNSHPFTMTDQSLGKHIRTEYTEILPTQNSVIATSNNGVTVHQIERQLSRQLNLFNILLSSNNCDRKSILAIPQLDSLEDVLSYITQFNSQIQSIVRNADANQTQQGLSSKTSKPSCVPLAPQENIQKESGRVKDILRTIDTLLRTESRNTANVSLLEKLYVQVRTLETLPTSRPPAHQLIETIARLQKIVAKLDQPDIRQVLESEKRYLQELLEDVVPTYRATPSSKQVNLIKSGDSQKKITELELQTATLLKANSNLRAENLKLQDQYRKERSNLQSDKQDLQNKVMQLKQYNQQLQQQFSRIKQNHIRERQTLLSQVQQTSHRLGNLERLAEDRINLSNISIIEPVPYKHKANFNQDKKEFSSVSRTKKMR